MGTASSEQRINYLSLPAYLQRLIATLVLIGYIDSLALLRIIIVQYHRIHIQYDYTRLRYMQSPDKKFLQYFPVYLIFYPDEFSEKSFDHMRGYHLLFFYLDF